MEQYIEYLDTWFEEELSRRKFDGFIVGLSGGVDSAVVAYLLARKYKKQMLAVIMPSKSDQQDVIDAELVAKSADIPYEIIDLTKAREVFLDVISHHTAPLEEEKKRVLDGNARARLRMMTLFGIAQAKNYLVVGTDNAAEWMTGYFTKYGDGGVDISPLLHLNKSEVYEMAEILGVPDSIIDKKPSAGLWEKQTDEDEIGTTYEMIERHLRGEAVPDKDANIISFWHERSHHKREMPHVPKKRNEI